MGSVMNLNQYNTTRNDRILIQNCILLNHEITLTAQGIIDILDGTNININNCSFHHNKYTPALMKETISNANWLGLTLKFQTQYFHLPLLYY